MARDRNKVQEPRDTRDEDNSQDGPEVFSRLAETRRHNSDNGEKHEEFGTPDGVYYLLAGPRMAEAHDYCTTVPRTGAERSTHKPLTISNFLYSQHQGDDQHKDGGSEPLDKIRLAKIATVHATPARDYYLLADPRLAEAK